MPPAPPTPAENFAAILRWLTHAVVTRNLLGRLSQPLANLIIDRIREIAQRVARLAARVAAGTYVPRRLATPRPPTGPRPRRPGGLPKKFGWLLPLVPEAIGSGAQLETLLRDEAMAALLAAAPASLRRPLRSLCRMLRVTPPAILALPARPRPERDQPERDQPPREPKPPAAKAPPRPPRPVPAWWAEPPRRTRWTFARRRGPPLPS